METETMMQRVAEEYYEGLLSVQVIDGGVLTARVLHRDHQIYLCWVNAGGVPQEHLIGRDNQVSMIGWARELGKTVNKRIRSYEFVPEVCRTAPRRS